MSTALSETGLEPVPLPLVNRRAAGGKRFIVPVLLVAIRAPNACRHCNNELDQRERSKLCRTCQKKPSIRERYPTYWGSVRDFDGPAKWPAAWRSSEPGAPETVEDMERRASDEEELFGRRDCGNGGYDLYGLGRLLRDIFGVERLAEILLGEQGVRL
jgi:hypothetical protein